MAKAPEDPKKNFDSITPEERLFRVISADRGFDVDSQDLQESEILDHGFFTKVESFFHGLSAAVQQGIQKLRQRFSGRSSVQYSVALAHPSPWMAYLRIKYINRGLLVLVALLGAYLVLDALLMMWQGPTQLLEGNLAVSESGLWKAEIPAPVQEDLSKYLDRASQRNVFRPGPPPAPPQTTGEAPPPSAAEAEVKTAPSNFKLLGISWDADGYVAMIQHDPSQEGVAFVRKGETIGSLKVEEIKEFTVILSNGSQKLELS